MATSGASSIATRREWYNALRKPGWTPRSSVIGRIWSILYPVLLVCTVWTSALVVAGSLTPFVLVPMLGNIASNLLFTPIQFGLRRLGWASVDILIVLGTIPWWMALVWDAQPAIALLLVPYLVWVALATVIMCSIVWMNRAR